mgnify:FL=1
MEYKYEVTLSFAGEDREYVEEVAKVLKENNLSVFYDKFEEVNLWGEDLAIYFERLFQRESKYVVIFISQYYRHKEWTNYEVKNAFSRQINDKTEGYILPVRFDDTQLEGLRNTIGYLDARKLSPIKLAQKILEKVRRKHITSSTNNKTNKENEKSKEHHLYSTISSENVEIRLYGDY